MSVRVTGCLRIRKRKGNKGKGEVRKNKGEGPLYSSLPFSFCRRKELGLTASHSPYSCSMALPFSSYRINESRLLPPTFIFLIIILIWSEKVIVAQLFIRKNLCTRIYHKHKKNNCVSSKPIIKRDYGNRVPRMPPSACNRSLAFVFSTLTLNVDWWTRFRIHP